VGDSGGGFALSNQHGRWFLRGVVSYGATVNTTTTQDGEEVAVCDREVPSIYVDLAWYMDWIVRNVDRSP